MRRFVLEDLPPDGCEVYGKLKFQRFDGNGSRSGRPCCKMWHGKARKPTNHYQFPNEFARERWVQDMKDSHDQAVVAHTERKKERAKNLADMRAKLTVGTILHCGWGYEQTQCDFYEVISRTAATATLRRIGSRTVAGSEGSMSDSRLPEPGRFVGEPFRKRITDYGVSFRHGIGSPTDVDTAHYCSWYG